MIYVIDCNSSHILRVLGEVVFKQRLQTLQRALGWDYVVVPLKSLWHRVSQNVSMHRGLKLCTFGDS